jgi:putative cardiolipin synthase
MTSTVIARILRHRSYIPAVALCALLTAGCASLPEERQRSPSFALADPSGTRLQSDIQPVAAAHPDLSGFYALAEGRDAFAIRLYLIETAEKTLDLQYYIWRDDLTGKVLYDRMLAAADRGVRVRLLLDDLDTAGKDQLLHTIDAHPNVEVRLFNPFANRSARILDFIADPARVNRRMHNKSLTADNAATVFGGRNIGDEYFDAGEELGFKDLDVLAIGPVVSDVSDAFDLYWNSRWAYPLSAFDPPQPVTAGMIKRYREQSAAYIREVRNSSYAVAIRALDMASKSDISELDFEWRRWIFAVDQPGKIEAEGVDVDTHMAPGIKRALDQATREILIVSPYFVPGRRFTAYLVGRVEAGVRIRIMTNSLASNDVPIVYAGYLRYREALVRGGVELFEFKPRPVTSAGKTTDPAWSGSSRASLHGKYMALDQQYVIVGSFNLDPRSIALNTELGVYFESPAYAKGLHDIFNARANILGYQLLLDEAGELEWVTREDGREARFGHEPETSWWRRFSTHLLSLIVPEGLL